ncbi:MAG: proline reductase [Lachnospiraceae bacterium]|nr:proline reductase [Lachnospiraceae bacterium]
MGLGPSIKMTTKHHFFCPMTKALSEDKDMEFIGIIVDGVSEVCDDKEYTAKRTADLARLMQADAAVVAIDGWGNHHVDFVSVIEELGRRGIPAVGLSYIGQQGRLVCDNDYVDCIVDFNKNVSGYESCVVGDNNLTDYDAKKAVGLVKLKLKRAGKEVTSETNAEQIVGTLIQKQYPFSPDLLPADILDVPYDETYLKEVKVTVLAPGQTHLFVNSNLDFFPIAAKEEGELGEGITRLMTGVTMMVTGAEEGGFQPSNIGSSEGLLKNQVVFDRAGTPATTDYLIHVDVTFQEGHGRSAEGILEAHRFADRVAGKLRKVLLALEVEPASVKVFHNIRRPGKRKVVLVKIVSGLGNMYDTAMFPFEPGGVIGAHNLMDSKNLPYGITPNQCRDGVIHSLL